MDADMIYNELIDMSKMPENPVVGLTKKQKAVIEFAKTSKISSDMFCEEDDTTRRSTLNALVNKGYLQKPTKIGSIYWLTSKGKRAHNMMVRYRQQKEAIKNLSVVIGQALEWFAWEHGEDCSIIANGFDVPDWVLEARTVLDETEFLRPAGKEAK